MKKQINKMIGFNSSKPITFLLLLFLLFSCPALGQTLNSESYLQTKPDKAGSLSVNTIDNQIMLSVHSPNNTNSITIIYFKEGNNNGIDLNDGLFLVGGNPLNTQIFSYINSDRYCINALNTFTAPISVNIGFEPKVNGNFIISSGEIQSFNTSSSVILEDLKTHIFQDLRVNPVFNFTATTTDAVNRFKLHFNLAYTWNTPLGNWNAAGSWKPLRTNPANSDILVFDGSVQPSPSVTLDFISPQSIGKLKVINNAIVGFVSSNANRVLNIGGLDLMPPHFVVDSASSLSINTLNTVDLNLLNGIKGSVYGNLIFLNAAHKLSVSDTNGLVFNNNSVFTAGPNFSGDPFGATNLKAVVFAKGSTYKHKSLYPPFLNARILANFELDASGFNNNLTGNSGFTMDNLIITNCTAIGLNYTGPMIIKANIILNNGLLSFSPDIPTTVLLNGTTIQTISGGPGALSIGANADFIVDNSVIIDRDIVFGGNLTINAAKSLTLTSGKQIAVASVFLIKSDVTGSGSLIHSNAINAKVEHYIPVSVTDDFHLLASPVAAQTINSDFSPVNQSLYAWNEAGANWLTFENTGFTSLNGSNNFVPGRGYAVSYSSTSTKNFVGTLNQGVINTNLTYSPGLYSGWNLVANPYPSAINWNIANGYSRNMLEDAGVGEYAYWVWNPIAGNYGSFISNGFFGTNGVSGYIASKQGFWVKTTAAATMSLNNNARVHFSSQVWLKSNQSSNTIRLKITSAENTYSDEMILCFGYPNDLGGAEKMFSHFQTVPGLFSEKYNKKWSISYLTAITNTTVVPVGFVSGKNGNYIIKASELNSFNTPYVYLKDLKTNTITDLNLNSDYSFTSVASDSVMRFQLIFALSPMDIINNISSHAVIYSCNNNIYINSNEAIQKIAIYNTLGQLIKTIENTGGNIIIPMHGNPKACYIVRVISNNNVYSEKLFIQ